jgi:hypothetical protein
MNRDILGELLEDYWKHPDPVDRTVTLRGLTVKSGTTFYAYDYSQAHVYTLCHRCGDVMGGTEYACLTCGSEMVERRAKPVPMPEEQQRAFRAMAISITSFLTGKASSGPAGVDCVDADERLLRQLGRKGVVDFDELDWHDLIPTKRGYRMAHRGLGRSGLLTAALAEEFEET